MFTSFWKGTNSDNRTLLTKCERTKNGPPKLFRFRWWTIFEIFRRHQLEERLDRFGPALQDILQRKWWKYERATDQGRKFCLLSTSTTVDRHLMTAANMADISPAQLQSLMPGNLIVEAVNQKIQVTMSPSWLPIKIYDPDLDIVWKPSAAFRCLSTATSHTDAAILQALNERDLTTITTLLQHNLLTTEDLTYLVRQFDGRGKLQNLPLRWLPHEYHSIVPRMGHYLQECICGKKHDKVATNAGLARIPAEARHPPQPAHGPRVYQPYHLPEIVQDEDFHQALHPDAQPQPQGYDEVCMQRTGPI